jgi:hypothetical protein
MSGSRTEANHFSPTGVPLHQQLSSHSSRRARTPDPEVITDCAKRPEEALGVLGRFEPAHQSLTLARRLVRILSSVVQAFVPSVIHIRQHAPQGGSVARELVGDHHPRLAARRLNHSAKECLGGVLITSLLDQDVEHNDVLVGGTAQPVALALDLQLHFVQMPCVTRMSASPSQSGGVGQAKLRAPGADGFVRHSHTAFC